MTRQRILVVDDHEVVRLGLRALLDEHPNFEVVAEAATAREAIEKTDSYQPDVVVMDIGMPGLNGIEATHRILDGALGVKVIVLSMYSDRQFAVDILGAGASGYLLKECAFKELVWAIRAATANRTYLSSGIIGVVPRDDERC